MTFFKTGYLRIKAIDLIGGLNICGVLKTIHEDEYLPKTVLDNKRHEKLERQFRLAQQTTGFYASFNSLDEVPVLTKQIIRQNPDSFLSNRYHKKLFKKATGGSTGVTLTYYGTVQTQSYLWASLIHAWKVAGYQYGDRIAFISGSSVIKSDFSHRIFYQFLNVKTYNAFELDEKSMELFITDIKKNRTTIVYGYSMVMNLLAAYISSRETKIDFPDLKGIFTTSEMLTDAMRKNIEANFGVKVYNQYGCADAGIMAFECGHHQLHLISSRCVYEVEKEGKFISTDLENDASIFMKYDTGDLVEFSNEECACGRKYPVISKIIGRSNDVVTDTDNNKLHSNYFNNTLRKDASIQQFQIVFNEENFTLFLAVDNSKPPEEYNSILTEVKKRVRFKEYKIVINAPFIKAENAKHRYVINTIGA